MTQTDLIRILVGALIGFTLPHLVRAVAYFIRRLRRARIEGKWFVYHPSHKASKPQMIPSTWYITKGFTSLFAIREDRKEGSGATISGYAKGQIHIESNCLLIKLHTTQHEEEVSMRLFNPISTADEILWGLYLSLDFQGKPTAGPIVVSRSELSEEDVMRFLSDRLGTQDKYKLLVAQTV
jgi:hypothetical protein